MRLATDSMAFLHRLRTPGGVALLRSALVCGLLLHAPVLWAQARREAEVLTVRGWGTVRARPDLALFSFRSTSTAPSAQEAAKLHRGQVAALQAALKGVLPQDVPILEGHLAFTGPRAGWVACTSILEFRLTQVDTLSLEELSRKIAEIIDTAVRAGADATTGVAGADPGPVRFQVSDSAGMHRKALDAAIVDARERAKTIAEGAGLHVGRIQALEEIVPRMTGVAPLRAEQADSGEFEVTVQVTLSLELGEE